jgi:AraC-like DNA-binding protein
VRNVRIVDYGCILCGEAWGIHRECPLFSRMYWSLGGDCRYQDEAGTRPLLPGRLYFMPQHKRYNMAQRLSDPFFVLWQHIQADGAFVPRFTELEIAPDSPSGKLLDTIRSATEAEDFDAQPAERREFVRRLECLTQALLSLLEEEHGPLFEPYRERMSGILADPALESGCRSVEEMASAAGMERSYFSRMFRKQFGVAPQQWLTQTRLSTAAQRLLEGAAVGEAAEAAGYQDAKAFTRAFGREFGRTPSEYKKSHNLQP